MDLELVSIHPGCSMNPSQADSIEHPNKGAVLNLGEMGQVIRAVLTHHMFLHSAGTVYIVHIQELWPPPSRHVREHQQLWQSLAFSSTDSFY